jgi:hypothetical protein
LRGRTRINKTASAMGIGFSQKTPVDRKNRNRVKSTTHAHGELYLCAYRHCQFNRCRRSYRDLSLNPCRMFGCFTSKFVNLNS